MHRRHRVGLDDLQEARSKGGRGDVLRIPPERTLRDKTFGG